MDFAISGTSGPKTSKDPAGTMRNNSLKGIFMVHRTQTKQRFCGFLPSGLPRSLASRLETSKIVTTSPLRVDRYQVADAYLKARILQSDVPGLVKWRTHELVDDGVVPYLCAAC